MLIFARQKWIFLLVLLGCAAWGLPNIVWAARMAVTAPIANVRAGPGTNYDVLWQIEKYHPIETVDQKENWYRFKDFEGDIGWIHQSLIGDIRTVVTRSERCNLRNGPGTGYTILLTVEEGIPFRVLKKQGKWLQVQHADGDRGWIHVSLVW